MGFFSTYGASKQDIVKECIADSPRYKPSDKNYETECKTLCHRLIGNVLWTVQEITKYFHNGIESRCFIGCYLLSKSEGDWGYRPMDEGMGPYQYNCPLKYLAMAPEANKEWREKVRAWHVCYSRKIEVGKTYTLIQCRIPEAKVSSLKPLQGTYDGHTFSLKKNLIGEEKV
jgi:hypothetical protein